LKERSISTGKEEKAAASGVEDKNTKQACANPENKPIEERKIRGPKTSVYAPLDKFISPTTTFLFFQGRD
jgi:hypothetical protein